jgi:hypothetical protein
VVVLEGVIVGENTSGAMLLGAILATGAHATAVNHASNANSSANVQILHL